jgi:hypothetical protein
MIVSACVEEQFAVRNVDKRNILLLLFLFIVHLQPAPRHTAIPIA